MVTPNFGHFKPISWIAIAAHERGHECHIVSVDNERGRNALQKHLPPEIKLHLTPGMEMDLFTSDEKLVYVLDKFSEAWKDGCIKKIKELNPDILMNDCVAIPGIIAARDMKIPMVVNKPGGAYAYYQWQGQEIYPNLENARNWFGSMSFRQTPI